MKIEVEGLAIRPAIDDDAAFRRRLFVEARGKVLALLPEELVEMQFSAQRKSCELNYPSAEVLILEKEGQPVGALIADDKEAIHIVDIAVLESHRNRGLGSAVLRAVQDDASQSGRSIYLSVATDNPAGRLYERLGFTEIGRDQVYRHMRWP